MSSPVVVFINGQPRQVREGEGILSLILQHRLDPKMIPVEHNQKALLRSEWDAQQLQHGDRMEFIRVVAGG